MLLIKRTFILILSLCCSLSFSQEHVSSEDVEARFCFYKLKNDSIVWGEHLETYEDRWFYQEAGDHVARFELLFDTSKTTDAETSAFSFISQKDIKKEFCWKNEDSNYYRYLKTQDLFFKNKLVKKAAVLTGNEGHHKFEAMFGNFAWDIGILDERASQHQGDGTELEDYYIFGAEVLSPLKGIVIGAVSDQEDNKVDLTFTGDLSEKTNNYLTIKVSPSIYVSIVHFKKDTITVKVGDTVSIGSRLGEVGNSGVSYLPHLHYTLYTYSLELSRFVSIPGYFKK